MSLSEHLESLVGTSDKNAIDYFDAILAGLIRAVTDLEEDGSFDITLAAVERLVCV